MCPHLGEFAVRERERVLRCPSAKLSCLSMQSEGNIIRNGRKKKKNASNRQRFLSINLAVHAGLELVYNFGAGGCCIKICLGGRPQHRPWGKNSTWKNGWEGLFSKLTLFPQV